jgi:aminoglycoside 3-N-acetyltransferase
MDYNIGDIKAAYHAAGVRRGCTVLLKTDIRFLGLFDNKSYVNNALQAHFEALSELIDLSVGTLVVSTSSTNLSNTDNVFDIHNTPSERGVLTEFIRQTQGAIRSFHPFHSYTAIGKDAEYIVSNVSKHAFGFDTPEERLIKMDAICVSVGLPVTSTCTTVHHIEFLVGVPYRYTKEFLHPVLRDGKVRYELYYMFVNYRKCEINRNRGLKIFDAFNKNGYKVSQQVLGRGNVYSYSLKEFYHSTMNAFKDDIYIWLDEPPITRPYRE